MSARFNKTEAKMYAALGILFRGEKFGSKNFMTFDGMTPERAEELESYKNGYDSRRSRDDRGLSSADSGIGSLPKKVH